jgi:hypothetical protein
LDTTTLLKKIGVNVRTQPNGDILIGIHPKTFNEAIEGKLSAAGWANVLLKQRDEPSPEGYSHKPYLVEFKKS